MCVVSLLSPSAVQSVNGERERERESSMDSSVGRRAKVRGAVSCTGVLCILQITAQYFTGHQITSDAYSIPCGRLYILNFLNYYYYPYNIPPPFHTTIFIRCSII